MNEQNDILSSLAASGNPFKMPEGYLDGLEDRLLARIAVEEQEAASERKRPVWRILKPALTLAATFAIIFGMGYGVLALTHTLDRGTGTADVSEYASVEEELIQPVSIINYYQSDGLAEDSSELDEDALIDYLASELSFSALADIYAQTYREK